ncbi:uncharacterized protein LOC144738327 isoform X2 [Lampetra planeri]
MENSFTVVRRWLQVPAPPSSVDDDSSGSDKMASLRNVFKIAAPRGGGRKMAASRRSSPATPKMAVSCRVSERADCVGKAPVGWSPLGLPELVVGVTRVYNCVKTAFSDSSWAAACRHPPSASTNADGPAEPATSCTPGASLVPVSPPPSIVGSATTGGRSSSEDGAEDGAGTFFLLSCFDMPFHFRHQCNKRLFNSVDLRCPLFGFLSLSLAPTASSLRPAPPPPYTLQPHCCSAPQLHRCSVCSHTAAPLCRHTAALCAPHTLPALHARLASHTLLALLCPTYTAGRRCRGLPPRGNRATLSPLPSVASSCFHSFSTPRSLPVLPLNPLPHVTLTPPSPHVTQTPPPHSLLALHLYQM